MPQQACFALFLDTLIPVLMHFIFSFSRDNWCTSEGTISSSVCMVKADSALCHFKCTSRDPMAAAATAKVTIRRTRACLACQ